MARNIKITEKNGEFNVRNISDAVSRNESVMAARWQCGGEIKSFAVTPEAEEELRQQAHVEGVEIQNSDREFYKFLRAGWGDEIARSAV